MSICGRKNANVLLYAVTDGIRASKTPLYERVEAALRGGVTMVQLRDKTAGYDELLEEALALAKLCKKYGAAFIVNDSPEIAIKSGADGVHVGQGDADAAAARKIIGENKILGVSARTVEQALRAEADGADYLGTGAAFATATKPDAKVIPHETYREICNAVSIPVAAIGGITRENLHLLGGSGISGAVFVSAIFSAEDIEAECRALREMCGKLFGKV